MKPKIYTASKLDHALLWAKLWGDWTDVEFTARWVEDYINDRFPDKETHASIFWKIDEDDVRASDFVLVYGPDDDVLRGALVEAGMGIAASKIVICVGTSPSFGTWRYHPQCYRVATLEEAHALIIKLHSLMPDGDPFKYTERAVELTRKLLLDLQENGYMNHDSGLVETYINPKDFSDLCTLIGVSPNVGDAADGSGHVLDCKKESSLVA